MLASAIRSPFLSKMPNVPSTRFHQGQVCTQLFSGSHQRPLLFQVRLTLIGMLTQNVVCRGLMLWTARVPLRIADVFIGLYQQQPQLTATERWILTGDGTTIGLLRLSVPKLRLLRPQRTGFAPAMPLWALHNRFQSNQSNSSCTVNAPACIHF